MSPRITKMGLQAKSVYLNHLSKKEPKFYKTQRKLEVVTEKPKKRRASTSAKPKEEELPKINREMLNAYLAEKIEKIKFDEPPKPKDDSQNDSEFYEAIAGTPEILSQKKKLAKHPLKEYQMRTFRDEPKTQNYFSPEDQKAKAKVHYERNVSQRKKGCTACTGANRWQAVKRLCYLPSTT